MSFVSLIITRRRGQSYMWVWVKKNAQKWYSIMSLVVIQRHRLHHSQSDESFI